MKTPTERVVQGWKASIKNHGVARVKLRAFLRHFGAKRRGTQVQALVEAWLKQHRLFTKSIKYLADLDEQVSLYDQPVIQIGQLADSELALQK